MLRELARRFVNKESESSARLQLLLRSTEVVLNCLNLRPSIQGKAPGSIVVYVVYVAIRDGIIQAKFRPK